MIEVLTARDPAMCARWDALVDGSPHPDVYYRPGYARAYEATERARALALVIRGSLTRALLPLALREHQVGGAPVRDAFSPYGYGGLCLLEGPQPPSREDLARVLGSLQEWCARESIVACVIRLHPLLQQAEYLGALQLPGLAVGPGTEALTIALDVQREWDGKLDAPAGMRKGRRSDLAAARRALAVTLCPAHAQAAPEALQHFRRLYQATMDRVGAAPFLQFPAAYYDDLAQGLGDRLRIAVATLDGRPVGGALFMADREFAHYHLSASDADGLKHKAATLLITAGAHWARERGCRLLHLGGGLAPGDSLFDFKQSFGGAVHRYRTLTLVADPARWAALRDLEHAPWPYSMK